MRIELTLRRLRVKTHQGIKGYISVWVHHNRICVDWRIHQIRVVVGDITGRAIQFHGEKYNLA